MGCVVSRDFSFLDASACEVGAACETDAGAPPNASLSGSTLRAESASRQVRGGATVRLTSLPAGTLGPTTSNVTDGSYAFPSLLPNTLLEFETWFPQSDPEVASGIMTTRSLAGNASGATVRDVPVVEYRWLATVAWQCDTAGLFATADDAIYDASTHGVNRYFIQRATILGEVIDAAGNPVTLTRSMIHAALDQYDNFDSNPADATQGTTVCLLEQDAPSGRWVGTKAASTTSGRFVMFRVRNRIGTGVGWGQVTVANVGTGTVNLRSAGSVGVVRVQPGANQPPPADSLTFGRDIYPLFSSLTCVYCHTPGQPGYTVPPRRGGLGADFSGTADQVYQVLMANDGGACSAASPARVCPGDPTGSLLYTKPRLETGSEAPDHQGIAYPEDNTAMQTIYSWIANGATR